MRPAAVPDLASYDAIVVAFSGGKDSIACLAALIEAGVPPPRIELVHHDVDGAGATFMDWPSTTGYCRAVADAFGVPLYLSWKQGGLAREMLRDDQPTAPIRFETPQGTIRSVGGNGPRNTRRAFPQVSPDLSVRWCSAYLKIDCMAALIRNQERFLGRCTLIVTGERAEESPARAHFAAFEPDRSDTRDGTRRPPACRSLAARAWLDRRRRVGRAAPARRRARTGLPARVVEIFMPCCIFGSADQWSSVRHIAPYRFAQIAAYERQFRRTIHRQANVEMRADRGRPFRALLAQPDLARRAMQAGWSEPVIVPPADWRLPGGAFGDSAGPS